MRGQVILWQLIVEAALTFRRGPGDLHGQMAALSRAKVGYHIPTDNHVGLAMGRAIVNDSWPKYQAYFNGTAAPRD